MTATLHKRARYCARIGRAHARAVYFRYEHRIGHFGQWSYLGYLGGVATGLVPYKYFAFILCVIGVTQMALKVKPKEH